MQALEVQVYPEELTALLFLRAHMNRETRAMPPIAELEAAARRRIDVAPDDWDDAWSAALTLEIDRAAGRSPVEREPEAEMWGIDQLVRNGLLVMFADWKEQRDVAPAPQSEDPVSAELAEAVQRGLRTVLVLPYDAGAGEWNGPELLQISSADRSNPNAYRFALVNQPY